ncbi:MAG: SDR family oxidoreductase [Verrucomicrobia bacterium]|nr:SDR family oxidoreductase [Verrucomicrobiota bacterium]
MSRALEGEAAIVTGAGRKGGIGAAICLALAREGANLLFTSWQPYDRPASSVGRDRASEELTSELRRVGAQVERLEIDLSRDDAPGQVIRRAAAAFNVATILVNNACHSERDSIETFNAPLLDRSYRVNVRAPVLLGVEFVRAFGGRGARRIISLTSGQLQAPMRGELAYAVTKAAIDAFTITFAAEVGHLGITVNAVDPGPTDTGWMDDQTRSALRERFALGRLGLPTDAANLVAFLARPEADWITGQVIRSNGGFGFQ